MNIQPILHSSYDKSVLTESHILLINGLIRATYPEATFNIYIVPFDQDVMPNEFQLELVGLTTEQLFTDVTYDSTHIDHNWYADSNYSRLLTRLSKIIEIHDIDATDDGYTNIEFTPRPL